MRAERTLEQCIKHGTTRMRTQVEVDPGIGMRGFEGVQSLIADYKWAIDIEICVFPQEGLISYPGPTSCWSRAQARRQGDRRRAALRQGRGRPDPSHLRAGARVRRRHRHSSRRRPHARRHERPPGARTDRQYQRGGRVVVGHMAKLSLLPPDQVAALARRLADSGVAVTVLPTTDLFLMGATRIKRPARWRTPISWSSTG